MVSSLVMIPRPAGRSRHLDFNLSFSSSLVADRTISPSLDKIAGACAPGELKVNCEGILLCNGQIGARLRGCGWRLPKSIGLPLGRGKAVRDDGTEEGGKGIGRTSVSSSGL